ncbi:MAG TPA: tetratricopeptide repeat protein, partial [bacterium]|nr:tetratricopeptide repeat protein [bacterium]
DLLMVDGSVAQATGLYEQVVAMLDPRDRERRSIRGSAMGMLAVRWRDAGDLEQARRWIERAQKEFRIDVQDESCRDGLLSANMTSATILAEAGDPQAAVQLLRSELGRFATAGPGLVRQAHLRAHFDRVLANCLLMAGRRDEALPILDAGVERCRALLARDESDRGAAYRLIEMLMLRERVHGEATGESDSDRVEAAAIAAQYGFASHANPAPSAHRLPR